MVRLLRPPYLGFGREDLNPFRLCVVRLDSEPLEPCPTCEGHGHVGSGGCSPEDPNPSHITKCPDCDGRGHAPREKSKT